MRSLSDTIERLTRQHGVTSKTPATSRLRKLDAFGANPGELTGWYHLPADPSADRPLVVVLHGCTQTAADYDVGSGWSALAEEYGFAVLFPEQTRQNNPNLCFNWFYETDVKRGQGEVMSIREMIGKLVEDHGIDAKRVFVTGLSAGGAMANAMLAAYPEVFVGGAIIAGLPYGVASTIPQAFDSMRGHGLPSPDTLQSKLRSASSHDGPWPVISVWQGTADRTVDEANARAVVEQWQAAHGVSSRPTKTEKIDGYECLVWSNGSGTDVIELYRIEGMGHGTPLAPGEGYGRAGPFMLDVGISSTEHIARNWGLTASFARRSPQRDHQPAGTVSTQQQSSNSIQQVIESALRTAGLMK